METNKFHHQVINFQEALWTRAWGASDAINMYVCEEGHWQLKPIEGVLLETMFYMHLTTTEVVTSQK